MFWHKLMNLVLYKYLYTEPVYRNPESNINLSLNMMFLTSDKIRFASIRCRGEITD